METGKLLSIESDIRHPKLSVIVPVYNTEAYIEDCLESILRQNYVPMEIIAVNDGSTDRTTEILDAYAEKYPDRLYVIHTENGGVTHARLLGVQKACGDWIGFVDGDDVIACDMYERLMKNAVDDHADISHCGYQTIVNGGERIHYFYNTGRKVKQNHEEGLKDLIEGAFVEPGLCNKIYRKCLFQSFVDKGLPIENLRINEDLLMNYLLFSKADRAVYEDFCPYHYMVRSTSATRSGINVEKLMDPVRVKSWIWEHAEEEVKELALHRYLIQCANTYVFLMDHSNTVDHRKDVRRQMLTHKMEWKKLGWFWSLRVRGVVYLPHIYHGLYRLYTKHSIKKYE